MSDSTWLNQCATPGGMMIVAGPDPAALSSFNRGSALARPHQNGRDHVVGRDLAGIGDGAAGDEGPRALDDVIDLGDLRVIDRALLRRLCGAMQHADRNVVLAHVDDADLLIENAV